MEMEGTDFDPTTEGDVDINEPLTDDDYTSLIPRQKETRESWGTRARRRLHLLSEGLRDRMWADRDNLDASRSEYIPLINREMAQDSAVEEVLRLYPEAKTSKFITAKDEFDRVVVKLKISTAHAFTLAELQTSSKVSSILKMLLGPSTSGLAEKNDTEVVQNDAAIAIDETIAADPQTSEADATAARERIAQREQENEGLEARTEALEERMTLREKVKRIFRKYGVTVFGVAVAAGAVIGTVVSALSRCLAAVGGAVGNGLKAIGKKLGELLPVAIGAIVSFLFRTAGEVVGFLAKNAWLLIVGVVVFLVERMSEGRKKKG
ncbi:hypothetical protein QZH41_001379 [Actinostola sp. cb2023]|nr:hypothetical protein QZH41_001379 [Actinostola sp. cb2023]